MTDPAALGTLCGCISCQDERVRGHADDWPLHMLVRGPLMPGWRYCCELCGNKRCPHHSDHRFACTRSNEPGQVGTVVGAETAA